MSTVVTVKVISINGKPSRVREVAVKVSSARQEPRQSLATPNRKEAI